jgi:hypothetical protein
MPFMRRVMCVVMAVAVLAAGGCSKPSAPPTPPTDEIIKAAQPVLSAAIETKVNALPTPISHYLDATVAELRVTKSDIQVPERDGPSDGAEHRVVRQEGTVRVRLSPSGDARAMVRVVPADGRIVPIEVSAAVTVVKGSQTWTAEHPPDVAFEEPDPLTAADQQSVRYAAAEAILALFDYSGDVGTYNAKQGRLDLGGYATHPGIAGVVDPRLDPPPTLALQGPTWLAPGGEVNTYGSAWLRPPAASVDERGARNAALWLLDVLSTEDTRGECQRLALTRMSTDGPSYKFTRSYQSQLYDGLVVEGDTEVTAAGWSGCRSGLLSAPTGTRGATTVKVRYRATVVRFHADEEWFIAGLSLSSTALLTFPALPEEGSENLYDTGTRLTT